MPRGYRKHKGVSRKEARGGSSKRTGGGRTRVTPRNKKKNSSSDNAVLVKQKKIKSRGSGVRGNAADLLLVGMEDPILFSSEQRARPRQAQQQQQQRAIIPRTPCAVSANSPNNELASFIGECSICQDIKPLVKLMKKCQHNDALACLSCLRRIYIHQAQQNASNYPLSCFHPSCKRLVRDEQIKKIATPEELKQHYRLEFLSQAARRGYDIANCNSCSQPKRLPGTGRTDLFGFCSLYCRNCQSSFSVQVPGKGIFGNEPAAVCQNLPDACDGLGQRSSAEQAVEYVQRMPSRNGLSCDEKGAIYMYSGNFYRNLNESLRHAERALRAQVYAAYLGFLLSAHKKLVRQAARISLFRGIPVDVSRDYKAGTDVTWWGVSSCTTHLPTALNFGGNHGTLFHIQAKTAVHIEPWSAHAGEREWLLAPGTVLRVTKVVPKGGDGKAAEIYLEEVSSRVAGGTR